MPDGQRVRQNFQSRDDAVARKSELEIQALNRPIGAAFKQTRLTQEQLAQAEAAFLKLGGEPLMPAVEFFLTHGRPTTGDITIAKAIPNFVAAKHLQKKLRDRTLQDYESRLRPLEEIFGKRSPRSISRLELEPLIFKPGQSPDTANGNRRVLHTFFEWCVDQDFAQVNPVSRIATAERDEKEPEIMTQQEVRLLLHAAMTNKEGKILPCVVLGLFLGLRPEEITRLEWSHVDLDQKIARIQGNVAKLRQRRVIEMPGYAVEWLKACDKKQIIPKNLRRNWDAIRRAAGYKGSYPNKGDAALKEWPQDVIRHTAISCFYALGKDEDATAYWAGNSPDTVHRFYKGLVTPQEAQEFWALKPDSVVAKIIPLSAAA
jgi:integrase